MKLYCKRYLTCRMKDECDVAIIDNVPFNPSNWRLNWVCRRDKHAQMITGDEIIAKALGKKYTLRRFHLVCSGSRSAQNYGCACSKCAHRDTYTRSKSMYPLGCTWFCHTRGCTVKYIRA